jgi:galactoside 2-L-fucosyltransferase 1/2
MLVVISSVIFLVLIGNLLCFLRWFHRPTTTIVAQSGPGRLGNQIFQYASALGISHATGVNFCVSPDHPFPFDAIFQGPFPLCKQQLPQVSFLPEAGYGIYTSFRMPNCFISSCFVSVGPYLQSYKYLDADLSQTFVFLPAIQQEATKVMNQLRSSPDMLLIGIHVRRGDVANSVDYLRAAPMSYFGRAMDHYEHKYIGKQIKFLIASDDIPWCQEQDLFRSAAIVHSSPAVDLAILSLCDHIIMSVGTFGWFAGKFAGGGVVYYKDAIIMEHSTNEGQIRLEDYYPPAWIPMS